MCVEVDSTNKRNGESLFNASQPISVLSKPEGNFDLNGEPYNFTIVLEAFFFARNLTYSHPLFDFQKKKKIATLKIPKTGVAEWVAKKVRRVESTQDANHSPFCHSKNSKPNLFERLYALQYLEQTRPYPMQRAVH